MNYEKQCIVCAKPFIAKRKHSMTCSASCRGKRWRAKSKTKQQNTECLEIAEVIEPLETVSTKLEQAERIISSTELLQSILTVHVGICNHIDPIMVKTIQEGTWSQYKEEYDEACLLSRNHLDYIRRRDDFWQSKGVGRE